MAFSRTYATEYGSAAVTALLPSAFVAALSMASVWRDLHAFVRDGGSLDAVIARAHDAVNNGEPCAWRAEDHVMGIDEYGMLVQGVVLPEPSGSDKSLLVQPRDRYSSSRHLVCTASVMPMLVVDMEDAGQRERLAQLHKDTRMDVVWRAIAVHCTSKGVVAHACCPMTLRVCERLASRARCVRARRAYELHQAQACQFPRYEVALATSMRSAAHCS